MNASEICFLQPLCHFLTESRKMWGGDGNSDCLNSCERITVCQLSGAQIKVINRDFA